MIFANINVENAMTLELIHFGNQTYGYILLIMVLGSGLTLTGLFCRWFYTLFMPSKRVLKKRNRILLFVLISWPLLIAGGSFWAVYRISYCHFYSLRIGGEQKLVARYLWPKGEVEIPTKDVVSVALIQKGAGWKASNVLVIRTKNGRDYVSTSPVPDSEVLPDKIREAISKKGQR